MAVLDRFKSAWNAFSGTGGPWYGPVPSANVSYSSRSEANRWRGFYNEKTVITSIYTRIAIDVASVGFKHVKLDAQGRYLKDVDSELFKALTFQPNIDQGPRAFRQDIATTLLDKGAAAIVPIDTDSDPRLTERFDIFTLRVGEIVEWHPKHVKVNLYNENTGKREDITLEKRWVAIVENPLYAVMNEPNGTLQRLIRKLTLLDAVDEQSGSGRLDLIIQLPYAVKSPTRKQQAEQRREDLELQLKNSQYGVAYSDATEKIVQLNRPSENNLLGQIEFLTKMLYGQLGITEDIMNGTADEAAMLNYHNRSIDPINQAITEAMQRAFIGPAGLAAKEQIQYYKDPFKLVPVSSLADIADKFSRNEILTPNEIRGFMGIPPSGDPKSDELVNSNMPNVQTASGDTAPSGVPLEEVDGIVNDVFDGLSSDLEKIVEEMGNG